MIGVSHGKRGRHKDKEFVDKDEDGMVVETRNKDIKSQEIDGDGRFCGHRFALQAQLFGDKRCLYCGTWFHWKQSDMWRWIKTDNVDPFNVDDIVEPLHCGSDHCEEYHHLCAEAQMKRARQLDEMLEAQSLEMFKGLKSRGVI